MKFLTLLHLISVSCVVARYNYGGSAPGCMSMLHNCRNDPDGKCTSMLENYTKSCMSLVEEQTKTCNSKCRRSFTKLLRHPTMSRFSECECRGNIHCKRQKCSLIESCLNQRCKDDLPTTPPLGENMPPTTHFFTLTPSYMTPTIGAASATPDLNEKYSDCETVIVQCERKTECKRLMRVRDEACDSYPTMSEECSGECISANMALRNDSIGARLGTCVYATVKDATVRLTNIMRYCVLRDPSDAPTIPSVVTPSPDRPWGDCKRQLDECDEDEHCRHTYNNLMRACKIPNSEGALISTCSDNCRTLIDSFLSIRNGVNLWTCSCTSAPVSRNCDVIKHTFNDICSEEPCSDFSSRSQCQTCIESGGCSEHCGLLCKKTCGICANPPSVTEMTTSMHRPLSTRDESLPTLVTSAASRYTSDILYPPSPTPFNERYNVSYFCEDKINVRINYTPDSNYIPTFTAEDHSCKAYGSPPVLSLEYNPKKCGTTRERTEDAKYAFRNRIYVRSADHIYREIGVVDCSTFTNEIEEVQGNREALIGDMAGEDAVSMTFYSDSLYSQSFKHRPVRDGDEGVGAVLDLQDHKTVYVQLESKVKKGSFVVESCFATPSVDNSYSDPYYLLQNGCRKDASLNFEEFKPGQRARFSFSRMKFADINSADKVYIHCSVMLCDTSDPECHIECRHDNSTRSYARVNISQGPYTFSSHGFRISQDWLALLLLIALHVVR